ncbi:MAG: hypothetical protein R2716_12470 [Microthrixaceae bacterium]
MVALLVAAGIHLFAVPAVARPGAGGTGRIVAQQDDDPCTTPDVPDEPPCNPTLPASPWGTSHRSSYAQASSSYPGPDGTDVVARHAALPGVPVQLQFSDRYDDGGIAAWGSLVGDPDRRVVVKLDHDTGEVIDEYVPAEREPDPPPSAAGSVSGAYNMLDADGRFYVGRQRSIEVFADSVEGDRFSPIELVKRFTLPDGVFCVPEDVIAGATLTYDGHVAFVTEYGKVGTVPREPEAMTADSVVVYSINDTCDPAAAAAPETVSNNIAADETGGIYVVTSQAMHRVDWDAEAATLQPAWSAPYSTGTEPASAIRLGVGSGSTPSLMGTDDDDDRFVVITDGQELMHLVLFWRDEIPDDWQPVAEGADPRIACEVPVTFGDPGATRSVSEQSVLVRGYATVHVSNLLVDDSAFEGLEGTTASALAALEGGNPAQAPTGIERIDWDPESRSCETVWANVELSIPNGIPTMSAATDLFYGVGQRDGEWGIEAVDFDTGESRFWLPSGGEACDGEALDSLDPARRPALDGILERLPNSCENSFYAATEVGPDGSVYTGTFLGVTSYLPVAEESTSGDTGEAGAEDDTGDGDEESGVWPWLVVGERRWPVVGVALAIRRRS